MSFLSTCKRLWIRAESDVTLGVYPPEGLALPLTLYPS